MAPTGIVLLKPVFSLTFCVFGYCFKQSTFLSDCLHNIKISAIMFLFGCLIPTFLPLLLFPKLPTPTPRYISKMFSVCGFHPPLSSASGRIHYPPANLSLFIPCSIPCAHIHENYVSPHELKRSFCQKYNQTKISVVLTRTALFSQISCPN